LCRPTEANVSPEVNHLSLPVITKEIALRLPRDGVINPDLYGVVKPDGYKFSPTCLFPSHPSTIGEPVNDWSDLRRSTAHSAPV